MRRVGDEIATHLFLALQAGGHLVERIGERGQLLGPVSRDAGRIVALGDASSGTADLGQWTREHAREQHGQHDARDGGDEDGGSDDHGDRLVVHRPGMLGRVARLDHEGGEDVGADDGHADGQDGEADGRRHEGRQRDSDGDAPADHAVEVVPPALPSPAAAAVAVGAAR